MSEKSHNRSKPDLNGDEKDSKGSDRVKTRNGSKRQVKKRYDLDEDLSDVKPRPRRSDTNKDVAKGNVDLSKYKDEYKDLIQAVKCKGLKTVDKSTSGEKEKKNGDISSPQVEKPKQKPKDGDISSPQVEKPKQKPKDDVNNKSTSSMDAFQVMMEARKKSIGMNSPGKELTESESKVDPVQKEIKAKRLLALSVWADKKGAGKRKELEELRDENVKNVLEKRADSLKKMLTSGGKEKVVKTPSEKLKESVNDYSDIFFNKKASKMVKKRHRDAGNTNDTDSSPVPTKKSKIQTKQSQNKTNESDPVKVSPVDKKLSEISEQDKSFLKKLSPSIKKSESVLCYFEKTSDSDLCTTPVRREKEEIGEEEEKDNGLIKVKINSTRKKKKKKIPQKNGTTKSTVNENKECESVSKTINKDVVKTNENGKTRRKEKLENTVNTETECAIVTSPKSTQRPRRSVRRPIKYSQESDGSDSNDSCDDMFDLKKQKSKKKDVNKENVLTIEVDDKVSPLKIINLQSPGQLKCIRSPRTVKPCNISNEKIAPLFKKCLPKPKIDPSVIEARKLFLQSGVPEVMKKHLEKSVSNVSQDVNEFHTVHHVQQKCESDLWTLPEAKYTIDLSEDADDINVKSFDERVFPKDCTQDPVIKVSELFNQLETHDVRLAVKELKQVHTNFPIYKTFQQLWTKFGSKPVKQSSQDSGVSVDEYNNTSDMNYVWDQVWTDKYKPSSSHEIIGNFQAISSIKKWLECWKEYNETSKVVKRVRRDSSGSSDFEMSDSESRDSSRLPSNVMVITGPPGSGKTSAIYAIANELGINVLEVNSASRRTGKKIISDMHEATQSHKVLTKQNSETSFSGIFNKTETTKSEPKDNSKKSKLSLTKSKDKKVEKNSKATINVEPQKSPEGNVMSLMLIDDVDIVFEEDDGFINALSQIIQSSKRPVLLVATDENTSHLQRFVSDTNIIKFNPLSGKILGPWLDVLILIESNKVIPKLSSSILEVCNGDMRRCILQLQYWISGFKTNTCDDLIYSPIELCGKKSDDESNVSWTDSDCSSSKVNNSDGDVVLQIKKALYSELDFSCNMDNTWWGLNTLLQKPIEHLDKNKSSKDKKNREMLDNIHKYIDMYSVVDLLNSTSHFCGKSKNVRLSSKRKILKDSLSESENMSMYKNHSELSDHICQYMQRYSSLYIQKAFEDVIHVDDVSHIESLNLREQERIDKVYKDFAQGISLSSHLDRKTFTLDYMATLRCISRSEKARSCTNMKRNNRFHNYLNTLNISSNELTLNNACSIFYDS